MGDRTIAIADEDMEDDGLSGDGSGATGAELIEGAVPAGQRLDKAISHASGLSRERIKALIAEGAVTLDGRILSSASAKAQGEARFVIAVPAVLFVVFLTFHLILTRPI